LGGAIGFACDHPQETSMADFRPVAGQAKITFDSASRTFSMESGTSGRIALWGGGPKGEDLTLLSRQPQIVELRDLSYVDKPLGPNLRTMLLTARGNGKALIEARLGGPDGAVWAGAYVEVATSRYDTAGKIVSVAGLDLVASGVKADQLRALYRDGTSQIDREAQALLRAGRSEAEVAKIVVQRRNDLKQSIRGKGPELFKKLAEHRNRLKYGNPIGPDYMTKRAELVKRGVPAAEVDRRIIQGLQTTSKDFNAAGKRMAFVGTVGEVVGFALTSTQNSPQALPPLPVSAQKKLALDKVRLHLGIPSDANIDEHGHLKKTSYLQIDTYDPHVGDEMASETEEILWALGVDISYTYKGVRWTVPGRSLLK
jgi:hypothetical protein